MKQSSHKIIKTFMQHKKIILFTIILFTVLSAIWSYFQPNIYKATASIEIGTIDTTVTLKDNLKNNISPNQTNLNTEISIIKSRMLIKKALKRVDLTHRYYASSYFREKELYLHSPFEVELSLGENISFTVMPVKKQFYRLVATGVDAQTHKEWKHDKTYSYNQPINEKYFELTLFLKESQSLHKGTTYRFEVLSSRIIVDKIAKNLSVKRADEGSSVLNLEYLDPIAIRAKEFINVLAEAYLEQGVQKKTLESTLILNFIDKQLANIDDKLSTSETTLESFMKKNDHTISGVKLKDITTEGSKYVDRLKNLAEEEQMLERLYKKLSAGKNFTYTSFIGTNLSATGIPSLLERLQNVSYKRKLLRADYTMAHPRVKQLTKNINFIKKNIIQIVKTLKERSTKRKKVLEKKVKEYNALIKVLPEKEKALGDLQRTFIVNEKIYSYILEKRAATAIAKASTVDKNRLIDIAVTPLEPIAPNRILIILLGTLLGLVLGLLLALLLKLIDTRIKNEEDIREESTLTLIGSIPHIKQNHHSINVFESPKSLVSESFRALRTNIQFTASNTESLLISITSSIGDEGKSTIASNLAAILSLADKKVIVLNMDMRKPTLHKKFNLPNKKGISNLLSGGATLQAVIQKTKYDNIHIISSGPIPPNPSELIENDYMAHMLDSLKSVYDVIIFDTPPLGLVTDAMSLIHMSDITLFVLRANHSKKSFLLDIERIKKEHQIHGLSLVLNDIKIYKNGYGYYEEGK